MALNRDRFPGLCDGWARFDAPGGTQPVDAAIAATTEYLGGGAFANYGGPFPAARRTREVTDRARASVAALLGADPEGVVFGPSMTALTFRVAGAVERTLGPGDQLVVTRLDHDANVRPWELAAERSGAALRVVDPDPVTLELRPDLVAAELCDRTRWVAFCAASNVVGAVNDVRAITELAHAVGARVYVDAVHAAPHVELDLRSLGCDLVACSAYKWYGPHLGVLCGAPALLEELAIDKLRASSDAGADRWDQGTQPFELLAAAGAAADYLVETWWPQITDHEVALTRALVEGLGAVSGVRLLGAPARRTPTVFFTVDGEAPAAVAERLAAERIAVGAGSFYALGLSELLGLGAAGAVRAGAAHYTSLEEVERLVAAVTAVATR
ncbi:MAG: cysteine desulfurase-like protein [Solirubrobacterales bacterium]|nr:cysteine desulfurase-like protein [Solirubrobacterales bacterium]